MSEITKWVGQRIRNYRVRSKLSQEQLAERSGCHPTYIGQLPQRIADGRDLVADSQRVRITQADPRQSCRPDLEHSDIAVGGVGD